MHIFVVVELLQEGFNIYSKSGSKINVTVQYASLKSFPADV